jgi:TonB family protein
MRFGVIDLEPATLPALGAPVRPAPPPEVALPAEVVVPVDPPVEPATADVPAPASSPETAPGDPAGSPAGGGGEAAGEGGAGGGGEAGSTGGGSGPGGAPVPDFVRGRDTLPVVQSMTVPDYPQEAKGRSRVPVVLLVHVTAAGLVDDVRRGESTDCPPCETAAIASAWKLRFTPGTRDGVPVAMWVRYPVTFGRK